MKSVRPTAFMSFLQIRFACNTVEICHRIGGNTAPAVLCVAGMTRLRREDVKMDLSAGHVWVMISAALVLLMTPGLAFFYGGMTRAKSALNMMMMSFSAIALVAVVWVLWGYSMSSGEGVAQIFGNPLAAFGLEP